MLKKETKLFLLTAILIVAIFIFYSPKALADVYKINFITDPQTISSGEISGPITIQVQDQSGNEQKASETMYLNFSSSMSGEFSSNKDIWKPFVTLSSDFSTSSIYISTNSANRTFYYKGLIDGIHQVTVSAKSRSGKVFDSIIQPITIGNGSIIATTTTQDDMNSNNTTNTTQTIYKTVNKYISLHSSPEDLSNYDESTAFEVSAGRDRVTYIGVPISFIAKHKVAQNLTGNTYNFTWSYGDGTSEKGEKVSHIYKNPGEYNVILNGEYSDKSSVSRTLVKVLLPNLSINLTSSGDIELINNGKTEINLGDWIISDSNTKFVISMDTIVGAGKSIIISKEDSKINITDGDILTVNNPSNKEVVSFKKSNVNSVSENIIATTSIEEIISMSTEKADEIIKNYKKEFSLKTPVIEKTKIVIATTTEDKKEDIPLIQTASVSESIVSSSTKGFWGSLIGKGIKTLGKMFYDF